MKKLILWLLPAAALLFSACKKDTVQVMDFTAITGMDMGCNGNDTVDGSDWGFDGNWTAQEATLLSFIDTLTAPDTLGGTVAVSPACPNPSDGLFIIGINTERSCTMKLVCVNRQMQILYYTSKRFTGGPVVTYYDFRALTAFHPYDYYRVYYGFYTGKDSLIYKGHGDIRIE